MEVILALAVACAAGFGVWMRRYLSVSSSTPPPTRELPAPEIETRLRASLGRLPASLSLSATRIEAPYTKETRLVVDGVCPALTVRPLRPGEGQGVETGDRELDQRFYFAGPASVVRAILDAPARRALCALERADVAEGRLVCDVPDMLDGGNVRVERAARLAVEAAARLLAPADVPARLAAAARSDPDPRVRLLALEALGDEVPEHPAARKALQTAATDPEPAVRLAAGRGLRDAGRPVLLALATDAAVVGDSVSADAIDALRTLPAAPARAVLEAALRPGPNRTFPGRPLTARACVDAIARAPDPEHLPLLVRVTGSGASGLTLVLAAVKALAAIGTAEVVLPLQEAARLHGEDVEKMALRAVADIQALLAGTPGQVSLASAGEGQVALVDDVAGRMSPAPGARKD